MINFVFTFDCSNILLQYSALEMEGYLEAIHDGAEFEMTVSFLLKSEDADGYHVILEGNQLSIEASSPRAVLQGVYRLLHEMGCRFLAPDCEVVPKKDLNHLCISVNEKAAYGHRGVCIEGANSLDNVLQFIAWLPKLGYNSFFLQHKEPDAFLENWYQHKYNPLVAPETLSDTEKQKNYREIDGALTLRGLLHHRVGHGWTAAVIGRMACVTTDDKPTEDERPLLAKVEGLRGFWKGVPSNTNLCYANPFASQAFVDNVVNYAQMHPEVDYLHVWLADEMNNFCECPLCSNTTPVEQYISMLNEIDCKLHSLNLHVKIVMLLYQELLWPPIKSQLKNPARFTMMFAPINRTFEKSYAQRGALPATVPEYMRNHIQPPISLEENLAFLKLWQQKEPVMDSFAYDYHLGRAHYGDLGYQAISSIIAQDMRALSKLGLNGCISCQELRTAMPNALPNYVMGRMLWNPSLDAEKIKAEYYQAAYGDEWQEALMHLQRMSELSSCDYFNGIGPRSRPALAATFRQAAQAADNFKHFAATQAQKKEGIQRKFWKRLDYHCEYCTLMAEALAALADQQETEAHRCWLRFMQYIRQNELDFQSSLDVYRVLEIATKYTGFTLDIPR